MLFLLLQTFCRMFRACLSYERLDFIVEDVEFANNFNKKRKGNNRQQEWDNLFSSKREKDSTIDLKPQHTMNFNNSFQKFGNSCLQHLPIDK